MKKTVTIDWNFPLLELSFQFLLHQKLYDIFFIYRAVTGLPGQCINQIKNIHSIIIISVIKQKCRLLKWSNNNNVWNKNEINNPYEMSKNNKFDDLIQIIFRKARTAKLWIAAVKNKTDWIQTIWVKFFIRYDWMSSWVCV